MKKLISILLITWMITSVAYASSLSTGTSTTTTSTTTPAVTDLSDDATAGGESGKKVGAIDGIAQGKIDFYEGLSNDASRSASADDQLTQKYRLDKETSDYRYSFLTAYRAIYIESYKKAYREGFATEVMDSTYNSSDVKYTSVTMDGATITSSDSVVNINIEQGAVYLDNNVRVDKLNMRIAKEILGARYIQASNVYRVQVKNEDKYMSVYKPMTMTFKYVGPENVGVYKITDAGIIYYASKVNNGSIEAVVDEKMFYGGDYVVLIDKNFKGLSDIDDSWAKDEITLMAKRGWINGYEDGAFRPLSNITRAEFAVMLYNIFGWYNYNIKDDVVLHFTDANQLGPWGKKAVYAAVVQGVITGYPDSSFRPNQKITYQEVEWLIQKAYKDKGYAGFAWETMAQVMMDEKGAISKGLTNKTKYITRDEVAYMLYIINRGM